MPRKALEKRWLNAARGSFYTFLGDLYYQLYAGHGGTAALMIQDRSWNKRILEETTEEIERLLAEHKIRETYRHDYSEEYGVLRVFTEENKEKI
jgi:hypothetical protein